MSVLSKREEFVKSAMHAMMCNIETYRPMIKELAKTSDIDTGEALGVLATSFADETLAGYYLVLQEESDANKR